MYIYSCCYNINKIKNIYYIINLIVLILIFVTPISLDINKEMNYMVVVGTPVLITNIVSIFSLGITLAIALKNRNILKEKILSVILIIILLLLVAIIREIAPHFICMEFLLTLSVLIMYNTIENPDLKLLNEVNIAKVEVEKANSAKSEFLKNMSHEIATPINKAKGMNYLIMESDDINEIKENAKVVDEYLTQLSDISKNIIDVIKLESNSLTLENNVYYPEKLFDDIEKLALRKIDTKKIEFKLKINKLPNALYGDAPKIKHIISELITNAIKYTDKGKITLSVKSEMKDNKCILFVEVKDTGIGIKKENQKELFNYFSRVDLNNNITINGMGLGLSICKQLVEMMNGKINVESEYKKGSRFYFEIEQELMEGK